MKDNINWVKVCPKCCSTDILPYTKAGLSEGEILIDFCKNCNYGYPFGGFFPEVDKSKLEWFRKNLNKNNPMNKFRNSKTKTL